MTDSSKPDMTAKLKEALGTWEMMGNFFPEDLKVNRHWPTFESHRIAVVAAAKAYLELLESPDVILIRKVDGEWPKDVRQAVGTALAEAAAMERRHVLTVDAFQAIQLRLLDALSDSLAKEGEAINDN